MNKSPAHRDLRKCKLCIWVSQTCMAEKHPSEFHNLCTNTWKVAKAAIKEWGWIEGRILSHHQTVQGIASNYMARVAENSKVKTLTFELSLPSSLSYACWRLMPYLLQHQFDFAVSHYCFHSLPLLSDTTSFGCSHSAPVEKEMATHSNVLAWRIPGTEEPGGLPSMGSHRVGHNWSDLAAAAAAWSSCAFWTP